MNTSSVITADLLPQLQAEEYPEGKTSHEIIFKSTDISSSWPLALRKDINQLLDAINQDTLFAIVWELQDIGHRLTGYCAGWKARDVTTSYFQRFGYDSIIIDEFEGRVLWDYEIRPSYNVIATKVGSVCPDKQIVIGAHFDGVPFSPAADDNASGTAGVLEIARVLNDVETNLTFVFVAFDSKESGMWGSYHYVDNAIARGDDIIMMMNLDMIGHWDNDMYANLYYGEEDAFASLWRYFADSLYGMEGRMYGNLLNDDGDHLPFLEAGYDVVYVQEGTLSTENHLPSDSTTYMNFEYMTRMVKTTLATALVVDATAVPESSLEFEYPDRIPFLLWPGEQTRLRFEVDGLWLGELSPGTVELYCSVDGETYNTVPVTHLIDNRYEVFLPNIDCNSRLDFYLQAIELSGGQTVYDPEPSQQYMSFSAYDMSTVFADDFNSHEGWVVDGDASGGHWERGIPAGNGLAGDPTCDFDGSGYCFLTGNELVDSDVDDGTTSLISPVFDLSDGDAIVRYARWFSNDEGDNPNEDDMEVYISDGTNWMLIESVGPVHAAAGGWFQHAFRISDFTNPTSEMRVRFDVSDQMGVSVVEAALDAFEIVRLGCDPEADPDADGFAHSSDNCPFTYNPDQADSDGDGSGDACDACPDDVLDDIDGDGWCADIDNCPELNNPEQEDIDTDGVGNLCDSCSDSDADGYGDPGFELNTCIDDNCPNVANPNQEDVNGDGIGDACCCAGIRGDADGAPPGHINISDITYLIDYLFGTPLGPPPPCPNEGNANGDASENINISDIIYLVKYLYGIPLGPAPPACP